MQLLSDPNTWIAFLTLSALEIILGIDNIIFISVIANRLPSEIREKVRRFGLLFALVTRILLLLSLSWVMGLTNPLLSISDHLISGRDLILLLGGFFLIWKASKEIYIEVGGFVPQIPFWLRACLIPYFKHSNFDSSFPIPNIVVD